MGRRADEARQRHLAVQQLAQVSRKASAGVQIAQGVGMHQLADLVGDEVGVGTRRVVALVAPGLVGPARLGIAAQELEGLHARLIAQHLALKVSGDREDFQAVLLRQGHALLGVGGGAVFGVAAAEIQLPARLLPAVEASLRDELQPVCFRHIAELATHQTDLMIRQLAEAVLRCLLESHDDGPFTGCLELPRRRTVVDYTATSADGK